VHLPEIPLPRPPMSSPPPPPAESPQRSLALVDDVARGSPLAARVLPSFGPGGEFTVGAEEELLLVDQQGSLIGDAGTDVVASVASRCVGVGHVTGEIFTDQIELATDAFPNAHGVGECLRRFRLAVAESGASALAVGVHPASPFGETHTVRSERYDAITEEFAGLFRTPTSAFQVHIGMPDADTAITVYRGMRNRLAVFRALGAASPFWHGRDSGLASARSAILRSYPRNTPPPVLGSYDEYECRIRQVVAAAEVPDYTYVWWDLRPIRGWGRSSSVSWTLDRRLTSAWP
jgi:glutamate---cysteine ligase / carboxylate-amine ligase